MKRIFYLTSNLDSVEAISDDLHGKGLTDWRFHIVSKNESGLFTHHLHSANILYRSDLIRYMERGLLVGGLLAICLLIPIASNSLINAGFGAFLALGLFMTIAGAWIGGFGGITAENYKIKRFHDDIEQGKFLVMIDVKKQDVEAMERLMSKYHSEASFEGVVSTFTNPFAESDGKFHII